MRFLPSILFCALILFVGSSPIISGHAQSSTFAQPIFGFRDSAVEAATEARFLAVPDPKLAEEMCIRDRDLDFLRLALADEIATSLSYVRSLTIRPFATTSKYDSPTQDLQEAGRAMHVSDVITGHFLKEGSQLQITLEAVDVENNRTLWRDTMTVAAPDMIAMRGEINAKVRQGLVPALGAGADASEGATRPKNEEAYDLYLRSIAVPHDPQPNKEAIAMLERAVGLDPTSVSYTHLDVYKRQTLNGPEI